MSEHVHEWIHEQEDHEDYFYCSDSECRRNEYPLTAKEILLRLNATERLSAELALTALYYVEDGGGKMGGALRAYADTLEGKDD